MGQTLSNEQGRYVLQIPESGFVAVKGDNPFLSALYSASFANGNPIWVKRKSGDKPQPDEVALWDLPSTSIRWSGTFADNSVQNEAEVRNVHWWFIGTEADWKALDYKVEFKPGNTAKQPVP
jgi:hypothetical protein